MTLKDLVTKISRTQADLYAEKAVKLYKRIEDKTELREAIIDLSYQFLETIMVEVLAFIEAEYGISGEVLSKEELGELFYSKDGKTMEERIDGYVTDEEVAFIYDMCRFFSSEAQTAANKIMFLKLKKHFKYAKVENVYCCEVCMDTIVQLNSWTPIEKIDLRDLPPYHPECVCTILFSDEDE